MVGDCHIVEKGMQSVQNRTSRWFKSEKASIVSDSLLDLNSDISLYALYLVDFVKYLRRKAVLSQLIKLLTDPLCFLRHS
jgi:hypothetical protein